MVEPCSWCFCVHLLHHLFDSFHLIPLIKNLPIRGNGEVYVVEESTVNGGLFEIQPTLCFKDVRHGNFIGGVLGLVQSSPGGRHVILAVEPIHGFPL